MIDTNQLNQLIDTITPEITGHDELATKEVKNFLTKCFKLTDLYARKNHDYDNSFNKAVDVFGIDYAFGKLYDKMNRIIKLRNNKEEIKDESIIDTIVDMACYSIMTLLAIDEQSTNVDFEGMFNPER